MQSYLYQDLYQLEDQHWWHLNKREVVSKLISRYLKSKLKILDVGCGTGKNLQALKKFGQVEGLDNSPEAIKFCQRRGFKVRPGSAEKTTLPARQFDLVTLLDVLEHTDDRKTIQEMKRILKDSGALIITVPAFNFLWSKWDEVLHHKRRYSQTDLSRLLKQNGFEIVKISYLYSFLVLPALLIRAIKSRLFRHYYPSDFKLSSPIINLLLLNLCRLESKLAINWKIPLGTTLFCLAKKR